MKVLDWVHMPRCVLISFQSRKLLRMMLSPAGWAVDWKTHLFSRLVPLGWPHTEILLLWLSHNMPVLSLRPLRTTPKLPHGLKTAFSPPLGKKTSPSAFTQLTEAHSWGVDRRLPCSLLSLCAPYTDLSPRGIRAHLSNSHFQREFPKQSVPPPGP